MLEYGGLPGYPDGEWVLTRDSSHGFRVLFDAGCTVAEMGTEKSDMTTKAAAVIALESMIEIRLEDRRLECWLSRST